jgi:hypothetical protein
MPPQAARAEGTPKIAAVPLNQSREAHLAARPLHSPEGGQSAAVFAADWPPEGNLTSSNIGKRGRVGPAIGGGGNARGNDGGNAIGFQSPQATQAGGKSGGCGACQRSSTRRRRVHPQQAEQPAGGRLRHRGHLPSAGWRRPGAWPARARAGRPTLRDGRRSAAASQRCVAGWTAVRRLAGSPGSRRQGSSGWWRSRCKA